MRNITIKAVLLLALPTLSALGNPNSPLCSNDWRATQTRLRDPNTRIAFENNGGLANGGVCWWHSRFQRSAIYLTAYAPEKSKPTLADAKKIIHSLSYLSEVVEIPGYANFKDFSADFKDEIQSQLNRWQIRDGIGGFAWIRGLWGKSVLSPSQLQSRVEKIFSRFQDDSAQNHTLWFMEQMSGVVAHASLVVDMKKTDTGYTMELIDSNFPTDTRLVNYRFGDKTLSGPSGDFIPYAGIERDNRKIERALNRYCGRGETQIETPTNLLEIEN